MRARAILLIALVALAGCSSTDATPLAPACTDGPDAVTEALAAAPGEVRLEDGTPLSSCVRDATTDGDLQNLGAILTDVAERLEAEARTSPPAALRLGYLIGAARRGAPSGSTIQTELVRRLERSGAPELPPESARAMDEGMRAGERSG